MISVLVDIWVQYDGNNYFTAEIDMKLPFAPWVGLDLILLDTDDDGDDHVFLSGEAKEVDWVHDKFKFQVTLGRVDCSLELLQKSKAQLIARGWQFIENVVNGDPLA